MSRSIFVFGSNLAGRHGAGSAKHAMQDHGAIYGQGVGFQGDSYAIPTKDSSLNVLGLGEIQAHVWDFIYFAESNPQMNFEVVKIGCGLAGYKEPEIAPLFAGAPDNVYLPNGWREIIAEKDQGEAESPHQAS